MQNNENDVNIFAKYNIINLLFFIVICIIACCLFANYDFGMFESLKLDMKINIKDEHSQRLTIIFYSLTMIIIMGYYAITSNNEMNNKKELLPPIYKIFQIFFEGTKFVISSILAFLLYNIFSVLILVIAYSLNWAMPISIVLILIAMILTILITFRHFIPASLNYLKSLKIGDYFSLDKITRFHKKSKNNYLEYTTKLITIIGLSALVLLISFAILAVFGFAQNTVNISALDYEAYVNQIELIFIQSMVFLHILFFIGLILIPGFNKEVIKEDKKEEY